MFVQTDGHRFDVENDSGSNFVLTHKTRGDYNYRSYCASALDISIAPFFDSSLWRRMTFIRKQRDSGVVDRQSNDIGFVNVP